APRRSPPPGGAHILPRKRSRRRDRRRPPAGDRDMLASRTRNPLGSELPVRNALWLKLHQPLDHVSLDVERRRRAFEVPGAMLCRDPNEPGDLPTPQGLNRENSTRAEDWRNLLEPAARSLREACSPPWPVAGAPVHRLYGIEDPAMRRDRERLDL